MKCPKRGGPPPGSSFDESSSSSSSSTKPGSSTTPGKYVPIHQREGVKRQGVSMIRDDTPTLKVTNLSEDSTEQDLAELFRPFGHTTRIYLAKDKRTGQSRGFAFVSYARKDDAERAISQLNGHGYGHLILRVEWAIPREERDGEGGGNSGPPSGGRRM